MHECVFKCLPQQRWQILLRDGLHLASTLARVGSPMDKEFIVINNDDMLISINILEFMSVILKFCAACVVIKVHG